MAKIDYSSFDFNEIKNELINYLQSTATFRDYNFAGANITTLLEMVAAVGDLFNFYINAIANEYYLDTAELYVNLNRIAKQIGYNPGGIKSATVVVSATAEFTLDDDDYYFEVPKYSTFSCSTQSLLGDDIKYCTLNKVVYVGASGDNIYTAEWTLMQGSPYNNGDGELFSGDASEFQVCELTSDKAAEEGIEVWVKNTDGAFELWDYVPNLYRGNSSTSKVYTTRFNPNKRVEIQFGNGSFGVVPPAGTDNIKVLYIESLGEYGRIGAGEISGLDASIKIKNPLGVETATVVSFTFSQTNQADGGRDPLTEAEIAGLAPKFYRTQDRMVTIQDHEDKILSGFNDYVAKVMILNSDDYFALTGESTGTSGLYYNNLYIYVLPIYGENLTQNLQDNLQAFIDEYKMTSMQYVFKPIDFYDINPIVGWRLEDATTKTVSEVTADIESYLRNFFSRTNREFGEEIKYSDVMEGLIHLDGIGSVTLALSGETSPLSGYYENLVLTSMQFPRLSPTWVAVNNISQI